MNKFQKQVSKETKKRLDLDTKIEGFTKQLETMDTVGEIESILDQIDLLPSWYEVKKQVNKELKRKK
ncbi:hypothetical protein [uncultured Clostridium sp.]|uniref:hypothetical protein n=1 Tax=uncultured Clostridium sp. TaxID=59620 RepID=UPI00263139E1|nr:hypothetical protein [uncultured Clostridium sp.]